MAKQQTRKALSLRGDMYKAITERARALNMSVSEYVHGLAACDLETVGIVPPPYRPPGGTTSKVEAPAKARRGVDWDAVEPPKWSPLAKSRAAGEPVRVFRPLPPPAPFEAPEPPPPVTPDGLPSPHLTVVGEPCCSWCCEPFDPKTRRANRRRIDTERGPTHVDCAAERTRVESRTEQRRRYA